MSSRGLLLHGAHKGLRNRKGRGLRAPALFDSAVRAWKSTPVFVWCTLFLLRRDNNHVQVADVGHGGAPVFRRYPDGVEEVVGVVVFSTIR